GTLRVTGADGEHIGSATARHGIPVYELTPHTASLEEAFMELTRDAVEYREGAAA
ncbi:ABC transporter ATP-binding protein, partial [Streptomyces sp. MCAF7]